MKKFSFKNKREEIITAAAKVLVNRSKGNSDLFKAEETIKEIIKRVPMGLAFAIGITLKYRNDIKEYNRKYTLLDPIWDR